MMACTPWFEDLRVSGQEASCVPTMGESQPARLIKGSTTEILEEIADAAIMTWMQISWSMVIQLIIDSRISRWIRTRYHSLKRTVCWFSWQLIQFIAIIKAVNH
jgi:hypothetical protein